MIESFFLALVWSTRRFRHYMTEYSVQLFSRLDPLRYLFDIPVLMIRFMRWLILLIEFDIQYVTQKSIKRSVLLDHSTSLPVTDNRGIDDDFLDAKTVGVTICLVGACTLRVQPTVLDMDRCSIDFSTW